MRFALAFWFAHSNLQFLDCFLLPQSHDSVLLLANSRLFQESRRSDVSDSSHAVAAFLLASTPSHALCSRPNHVKNRHLRQPLMSDVSKAGEASVMELLSERRLRAVIERTFAEPNVMIDFLKDAGWAGVLAYLISAAIFYSAAVPVGEFAYYFTTGQLFDPRTILSDDAARKAEALALLASFYVLCKPFAPVRIGGALVLTPDAKTFIEEQPALGNAAAAIDGFVVNTGNAFSSLASRVFAKGDPLENERASLKTELLELAKKSRGGIEVLEEPEQSRLLDIIVSDLPALNPTPAPARSPEFSGQWECVWTTEKELNFAVDKGLFGLPWRRTYQNIDIENSKLSNVIAFDGGALTVNSNIEPDTEGDGSRFNFAFKDCSVRWRRLEVPLPPVGKGWGELLYLDNEMRIQRDIRGDLLVAVKV